MTTFAKPAPHELLNRPLGRGWRERASCKGADPAQFEERTIRSIKNVPPEVLAAAYRFCQPCPVRSECKAEADENPALTGLLGGVYRTRNRSLERDNRNGRSPYRAIDLLDPDND